MWMSILLMKMNAFNAQNVAHAYAYQNQYCIESVVNKIVIPILQHDRKTGKLSHRNWLENPLKWRTSNRITKLIPGKWSAAAAMQTAEYIVKWENEMPEIRNPHDIIKIRKIYNHVCGVCEWNLLVAKKLRTSAYIIIN